MRPLALFAAALALASLTGCPTTTPGRYDPAPDAGEDKSDDSAEGDPSPPSSSPSTEVAAVEVVIDRVELEVGEEALVRAQALNAAAQEIAFPTGVEIEWSGAPQSSLEIESDSPPNARITATASGAVTLTATVQGLSGHVALMVAEVAAPPDDGGVRYSYNGDDCSDVAVAGKDVWACAIMTQGTFQDLPMLQVCRGSTWLNYTPMEDMDQCEACGYDGTVTDPGAIYQAPACVD